MLQAVSERAEQDIDFNFKKVDITDDPTFKSWFVKDINSDYITPSREVRQ